MATASPRGYTFLTKYHVPTLAAAVFAMVWVTFRAHFQSITHDEADSFIGFAAQPWPSHWYPANGNHVLNSILMRLLTWMFGISHLAVRGPVLIGDVIYICAIYLLCTLISNEELLIWPLFVCLVYNPFVMDYMVAARGYSMALGFLLTTIWIAARQIIHYQPGQELALRRAFAFASAGAGLSFSAHFGFAYVNMASMLLFFVWACVRLSNWRERARLTAYLIPGLLVVLVIDGGVLWQWIPGQIYLGAKSYSEAWRSIIDSTFYELNPVILNQLLYTIFAHIQPYLPRLIVVLCFAQFVLLVFQNSKSRPRLFLVAIYLSGVIFLTMLLHLLQKKVTHLPLPMERYGIFFVPLPLLVFGIVTAIRRQSAAGRVLRVASIAVLFIGAFYFIGCLRMMYFRQYRFGADVQAAFPVIQDIAKRYGVREIPTSTDYLSPLNFYRLFYHDTSLEPFHYVDPLPPGKPIYVLPYGWHEQFIKQEGLKIAYHGEFTDLVVLVRQDLAPRSP